MVFKKGHKINLGRKGIPVSEETRRKLSESAKGRKHRLGTRHSEETKIKMIDSKNDTAEWKRKMSESAKGRKKSP